MWSLNIISHTHTHTKNPGFLEKQLTLGLAQEMCPGHLVGALSKKASQGLMSSYQKDTGASLKGLPLIKDGIIEHQKE